jgi:L-threonylcarbamoyladenylate synthase
MAVSENRQAKTMRARLLSPTPQAIAEAGEALRNGQLVAFPTETVYGLGADATNGLAVARIFKAKGRPTFNPLIVHVAGIEAAEAIAALPPIGKTLATAFWPGPLTLVLARRAGSTVSDLVSAGLATVAVRAPDHPLARALLAAARVPVAAPSANRSGHVSATRADHVLADLGDRIDFVMDGGPTAYGIESTVVDLAGDEIAILRPGAITTDQIAAVTGKAVVARPETGSAPSSPGQLASHYAPRSGLRLNASNWSSTEAVLAFGNAPDLPSRAIINLSSSGDLIEAASNLFAALRKLDAAGAETIAVMPIPREGLGEAINDRLRRAAAPRT